MQLVGVGLKRYRHQDEKLYHLVKPLWLHVNAVPAQKLSEINKVGRWTKGTVDFQAQERSLKFHCDL